MIFLCKITRRASCSQHAAFEDPFNDKQRKSVASLTEWWHKGSPYACLLLNMLLIGVRTYFEMDRASMELRCDAICAEVVLADAAKDTSLLTGNLHTAELLRWELYSYLRNDVDSSYENIFDRGPVANCLQFWGTRGAVDWGPVYQAQWQVSALNPGKRHRLQHQL